MRVSEGHLTQQYLCDYLTETDITHESAVLQNLFLYRMSTDGGFHARVINTILNTQQDRCLLLSVLIDADDMYPKPRQTLEEWLNAELKNAEKSGSKERITAVNALLTSYKSGVNTTAEIIAASRTQHPESYWLLKTHYITAEELKNPEIYFGDENRPIWKYLPLDDYAAYIAGVRNLTSEEITDALLCVSASWFSSLTRDEMITWLNMPRVTADEWQKLTYELLGLDLAEPALRTADWLYESGNFDAAADLYANITLSYQKTDAEKYAFEQIGKILTEFGEYENAFEAYKNAYLINITGTKFENAKSLIQLCGAGEMMGMDMEENYSRISKIAEKLEPAEKIDLCFGLASSMRRHKKYNKEYQLLEKIISEENADETIFSNASYRISEINNFLDSCGRIDEEALYSYDKDAEHNAIIKRGDSAYFGFDPECAMFWYNRADAPDDKKFRASIAAGLLENAAQYADTPQKRAMILAACDDEASGIAYELNQAVSSAYMKSFDISSVIEPVYMLLSSEKRAEVSEFLTKRSTRDDEKAIVCSSIGEVYITLGMADEARSILRAGLKANPSPNVRSRIFTELGMLENNLGHYRESCSAYESALKINDRFPAAWAGYASSLSRMGKAQDAKTAVMQALRYNSANPAYQKLNEKISSSLQ